LSKPGAIDEAEFAREAIVAHAEVPKPLRDGARELTTQPHPATAEDTDLLSLAANDLARVDRNAVCCLYLCDAKYDDLVVAARRTHQARGRAPPDPHGRDGCRRLGRRLRDRRPCKRAGQRNAG